MIKKEIYPKTKRMPELGSTVQITQKMDGSNLTIFKKNDTLYIAQRSTIYDLMEALDPTNRKALYPGLYDFLDKYGMDLYDRVYEGSAVCGEWLGMGKIKYDWDKEFGTRYLMFAKARVDDDFRLYDINHDHANFGWVFTANDNLPFLPDYVGAVPVVANVDWLPNKERLNALYEEYITKFDRPVEGFVCYYAGTVQKYVRMKNGKLVEYFESDHKGKE